MTELRSQSAKEAAETIAIETSRLQRLALRHEYPFLAYLLEMALLEAWREASGENEPMSDVPPPVDLQALGLKS